MPLGYVAARLRSFGDSAMNDLAGKIEQAHISQT
jgi:hypothetical protein